MIATVTKTCGCCLAPGSSLGGARPKASVRDRDGHLLIAKFPNKGDEVNTVVWEAVALTLAENAGIAVPEWRLESISEKPVCCCAVLTARLVHGCLSSLP